MIVGAAAVEIEIEGSRSLKEKRGVVQSICRRVRNRFNLAVAEVGQQDVWQRSVSGLAPAGPHAARVRSVLDRAVAFVEELHLANVLHASVEILRLPYEPSETPDPDDLPWGGDER
jgi:uncharacterized protein YlxP (DUF503 family)